MNSSERNQPCEGVETKTSLEQTRALNDTAREGFKDASMMEENVYPSGLRLCFILISVFMSMFLVALDRLIITTAIPQITDEFKSVTDIGWYGSAYLLTTCACQLLFGKLYSFFDVKIIFLTSVFLFEIGSAVCGAAPTSIVFIAGRAIAGIGGAGISSGVIMIIVHSVPLHKRPLFQGMFGAIFGVASVIGPLIGGVFTSKVTWRWCFYINLPLGVIAMVVVLLLLKMPNQDTPKTKMSTKAKLAQLDVYGTALIVPGSVCLILALQWGGLTYSWDDRRVIALLVLASVLVLGFILVQTLLPKTATIPPRIFLQRSVVAGFFSTICNGSHMMIFVYYLPIWFQAIQGASAVSSGLRILPLVLSMVVASILTGILVHRIGYYTPFIILGVCLMSVGAGLLNTLQVNTPTAKLIGYQIPYGFGLGCSSQVPNLAMQTVLPKSDVPIGTSLLFFSQLLGGAIFVSVGQNVLQNQLLNRLSSVPGFGVEALKNGGATSLTNLPAPAKTMALVAYNEALRCVFRVGLVLVCISVFSALAMEWRSVKETAKDSNAGDGLASAGSSKTAKGNPVNCGSPSKTIQV